jgi:hypothetical protein
MKKSDRPSEYFLGAILRAYDRAVRERGPEPAPSALWDYIVMECLRAPGGFTTMFQWDTSKAKNVNRIGTITECLEGGLVPGLCLGHNAKGHLVVTAR